MICIVVGKIRTGIYEFLNCCQYEKNEKEIQFSL